MKSVNRVPVLVALVAATLAWAGASSAAQAQEKTNYRDIYGNLLSAVGLGSDREPIDYSPRPPIAVPPSNTLPPPGSAARGLPAGFPTDPDRLARRRALADPRQPVPPSEGGEVRAYLIEPPSSFFSPTATPDASDRDDAPTPKHARKRKAKAVAAQ